jgi:hypothetical protein
LNQRPHPYQQNAGNRCANDRIRRSRSTVDAEVMCSRDAIGPPNPALIIAAFRRTAALSTAIYLHMLMLPAHFSSPGGMLHFPSSG